MSRQCEHGLTSCLPICVTDVPWLTNTVIICWASADSVLYIKQSHSWWSLLRCQTRSSSSKRSISKSATTNKQFTTLQLLQLVLVLVGLQQRSFTVTIRLFRSHSSRSTQEFSLRVLHGSDYVGTSSHLSHSRSSPVFFTPGPAMFTPASRPDPAGAEFGEEKKFAVVVVDVHWKDSYSILVQFMCNQ